MKPPVRETVYGGPCEICGGRAGNHSKKAHDFYANKRKVTARQLEQNEGKQMHDAMGRELKKGDSVVILGKITQLSPSEEYCNVSVETTFGRKPDGAKENISGINTAVLLKAGECETFNTSPVWFYGS